MISWQFVFITELEHTEITLHQPLIISNNVTVKNYGTVLLAYVDIIASITFHGKQYNTFTNHLLG